MLTVFVNGRKLSIKDVDVSCTLLQFLRKSGLTGAKLGCGEGGCGACTVMLSRYDKWQKKILHISANACLVPLCSIDGCAITTIEGIGNMKHGLHPIQQRIAAAHGSQCGFCTPGIVMALYAYTRSNPNASPTEIENSLDGNLCRCTGYRPILDAARSLSNSSRSEVSSQLQGCCKGKGGAGGCPCASAVAASAVEDNHRLSSSEGMFKSTLGLADSLQSKLLSEPIFPPELMRYQHRSFVIRNDEITWHQPVCLEELLQIKETHPEAKLVVGNTEVGIEVRQRGMHYSVFVNPSHIPELNILSATDAGIAVGAAVTINALRAFLERTESDLHAARTAYRARGLTAIRHMLSWFANNHIRNVASVGGNIMTASPVSDLNPLLLACNVVLRVHSHSRGARDLPIEQLFVSYRAVSLQPDEALVSVFIPFTQEFEFLVPFKQARRRTDDVSIVTMGLRVRLSPAVTGESWTVNDFSIALGGMAPVPRLAAKTASSLVGQEWSYAAIEKALPTLRRELNLAPDVPGGQPEYRMALVVSFLFKAYLTVTQELTAHCAACSSGCHLPPVPAIHPEDASATVNFLSQEHPQSRGQQGYFDRQGSHLHPSYTDVNKDAAYPPTAAQDRSAVPDGGVGQSLMHRNADAQVTGETKYVNDMPSLRNALHGYFVMSTRAHARLVRVDTSDAELCVGYASYLSARDIPGDNRMGTIVLDEELFATDRVIHYGQVIGVVLADTHDHAMAAARRVKVTYEDLPVIMSIDDAVAAGSFFPAHHVLTTGAMEAEMAAAGLTVQGGGRIGGQEHFYLETQSTVAVPTEQGHLEIFSSTQDINETQKFCASVCAVAAAKIVVKCKRMGGGFGGKESRSAFVACAAALAASLLNRPVSINLDRDVDMSITGQRHAFQYNYKAGMDRDGRLRFLEVDLYSQGGCSHDLSVPVLDRALLHVDGVYKWPALTARGRVCRTNQPSHTAFRGFGGPQGMAITETVMQHLSEASGVPIDKLKTINMYRDGDKIPCGQVLKDFYLPSLWEKLHCIADVEARRNAVSEFNTANRWRKRGIAVTPTKFGINFEKKFLNQAGALVHVYTDGSVLVAHGGTEMGQGLYTKVIQVAAQCFGIPERFITTTETASNVVANAAPTAASLSTDLHGMAVLDACTQIKSRLDAVRARLPADTTWPALIREAYFSRVDLSAHGRYEIDEKRCGYDWDMTCADNAERGFPFNYFTMGVACTEVEIDCLTGDSRIVRADILMDVGKSINPAIDIGQIEGAYMQGFGWSTMEELIWGDREHSWVRPGQLHTRGPGTYKIPSSNDVPGDFRVHLADTDNRFAIHSSKAVGEPPFFMGASVAFAVKDAVVAARCAAGLTTYYQLNLPATSERIRMACADQFVELCVPDGDIQFQPLASC